MAAALNLAGCAVGLVGLVSLTQQSVPALHWLTLGFVIPAVYMAGITGVAAVFARDVPVAARARVPVVLTAMHMCWGAGFLCSPRRLVKRS